MKTYNANMMVSWVLAILLSAVAFEMAAMPAKPGLRTVRQPDGTTVLAELRGDEHFHYYVTPDGLPLVEDSTGVLTYADSRMESSGIKASDIGARSASELRFISSYDKRGYMGAVKELRRKSPISLPDRKSTFPSQGKVRGLIILAEFKDVPFSSPAIKDDVNRMMNEPGFSDMGATGSARDYFISQSNGNFLPDFDVAGPVKLPHDMKFYGANKNGRATDRDVPQMVVDACRAASAEVDFSNYDFDGNGEVDLVFVIYSGYNEAQGGGAETIWPHAWDITSGGKFLRLNGTKIGRYACASELQGYEGKEPDGIGTFCHEFTHCLGLPDIYDSEYSGFVGLGAWDLMDAGGYNNSSRTPAGFSAYEREFCGWIEIPELDSPVSGLTLRPLDEAGEAFKIVSPYNPDEYYVLENRQNNLWDSALPGHGLVITHIDYDENIWASNIVNSARGGHPHIQIVPANNDLSDLSGAAFPGQFGNDVFSHFSKPASSLYSGDMLRAPVTAIRELNDGNIMFDFRTYIEAPVLTGVDQISETGATVMWDETEGAETYSVVINSLETGTVAGYPVSGNLALASGQAYATPIYDFDRNFDFTVCINVCGEKTVMNGATVFLVDVNGDVIDYKNLTIRNYDHDEYWVFHASVPGRLVVAASAGIDIKNLIIYNGDVEAVLRTGKLPADDCYSYHNMIENVSDTQIILDGLDSGRDYVVGVKGHNGTYESESCLSNKLCFRTGGIPSSVGTGFDSDSVRILPGEGMITVSGSSDARYTITDINGRVVASSSLVTEGNRHELQPGIYIVSFEGNAVKCKVR